MLYFPYRHLNRFRFYQHNHCGESKTQLKWFLDEKRDGLVDENRINNQQKEKLELMFMKHYAPNRCLYIKVAKLRTRVGSAEMSHLQNRCLKISG